jgi:hypothetical protein
MSNLKMKLEVEEILHQTLQYVKHIKKSLADAHGIARCRYHETMLLGWLYTIENSNPQLYDKAWEYCELVEKEIDKMVITKYKIGGIYYGN